MNKVIIGKIDIMDNGWKITANRFVAFIDLMGFKDLLNSKSHDEVYKFMKNNRYLEYLLINESQRNNADRQLKQIQASDSLMLVTEDDSACSLIKLIQYIAVLVANHVFSKVMIRGYVTHGLLTYDEENNIFFGNPFVKAYNEEGNIAHIGVIIDETIRSIIDGYCEMSENFNLSHLTYNVLDSMCFVKDENKKTIEKQLLSVNWYCHLKRFNCKPFIYSNDDMEKELLLSKIEALRSNVPTEHSEYDKINKYIDNTIKMAETALLRDNYLEI